MGSRVLVVATGPILEPGARVMSGQCLRTWHVVAPLLADGHSVRLFTVPIPGTTEDSAPPFREAEYRGFAYSRFTRNDEGSLLPVLAAAIRDWKPDALVGVNAYPAYLLARLWSEVPLWADLNGWTMAEGQVRAATLGHDRDFGHFWRTEVQTLLAADRFSAVSDAQAHAIFGELAMLGRLDHRTAEEPFACTIPNAVYPDFAGLLRTRERPAILREKVADADAPFVLWSGGFNSWTDVETLTAGLAEAMQRSPKLHFVATGGPIIGHDEKTWEKFTERAQTRLPKGRWHLLGWCDYDAMLALHACGTVGLSMDGRNLEAKFGARNRLTNMLGAGLPVATTRGTEIATWIERQGAGEVFDTGSVEGLARALVDAVEHSDRWEFRAMKARELALQEFSPAQTTLPLREWLQSPRHAPDRLLRHPGEEQFLSSGRVREWLTGKLQEPMPFATAAPPLDEPSPGPPVLRGQPVPSAPPPPQPRWRRLINRVRGR